MGLSESIGKTNMGEDMAEAQACSRNNMCVEWAVITLSLDQFIL